MTDVSPSALVPELGDLITIVSEQYKTTTGRIIYRDEALIRIRPFNVSHKAIDFPLDPITGLFREGLGVQELLIHEKAKTPYFAQQLSVNVGEQLEFYSTEGNPNGEPGIVAKVVASGNQDMIVLEDGRILDFGFIGPQSPFEVILQRSAPEDTTPIENNSALVEEPIEEEEFPDIVIDESMLPVAMAKEIVTSEVTYSDAIQREYMLVDLIADEPKQRQKNPRVLRDLQRKTDLMLAMKNSVVVRDETGGVLRNQHRSYAASTFGDIISKQPNNVISNLLPIAAVKKVLYVDNVGSNPEFDDVEIRADESSIADAYMSSISYLKPASTEMYGNPFLTYMDFLLTRTLPVFVPSTNETGSYITVDQDVLRSQIPPTPVQGFPLSDDMPSAIKPRNPEDMVPLTSEYVGTIGDRTARLLSASSYRDPKKGQTEIAPPDTATRVGYVLLSPELNAYRSPTRSSVLLWDIQASEQSRARTRTFYNHLMDVWEDQKVLTSSADHPVLLELESRIPSLLMIASPLFTRVVDSLGLRNLEMTDELMKPVFTALKRGQTEWDGAIQQLRERALMALQSSDIAPRFPLIDESDDLWNSEVFSQTEIQTAIDAWKERETSLENTTTARAAFLFTDTNTTLSHVWFQTAAKVDPELRKAAIETYTRERRRLARVRNAQRAANAALKATPTVNACPHVRELESLKGIREDDKRMQIFQKFVEKYQAGVDGNGVRCGKCEQQLVCRHELLLLNEFLHPGRGVALHKALLLEFSGPVFEGAYICKNCGQKIADLEYDTHLEFDDEGRPLVGRSTVDSNENTEELDMAVAMKEEGSELEQYDFTGEDLSLFYVARSLFESCGAIVDKEIYQRVIGAARDFLHLSIFDRTNYDARRRQIEINNQDPKKKKLPMLAPYESFIANFQIGVLGALAVLELQTSELSIPFPFSGCKFEVAGFPLEPSGNGTIAYVTCVIAGILRNDAPWNLTSWSPETNLTKRKTAVENDIRRTLIMLIAHNEEPIPGAPVKPKLLPITTVTDMYQKRISAAQEKRKQFGTGEYGLASQMDQLPHQFRPAQQPVMVPTTEESAIQNVRKFYENVETGAITEVQEYVKERQINLSQTVISAFHKRAVEDGIVIPGTQRSDSVCCFERFGSVGLRGFGIASLESAFGENRFEEIKAIENGIRRVLQRDPVRSANGSHLMVPWSAPLSETATASENTALYYRLFLKHCYDGENKGGVHEFGASFICRQCGFRLPEELEFLTASEISEQDGKKFAQQMSELLKTRQELILKAFQEQGIVIDDVAFHDLEDAIHQRKMITAEEIPQESPFFVRMEAMSEQIREAPFLPKAKEDWAIFIQCMETIHSKKSTGSLRRRDFSPFVTEHDALRTAIEARLIEMLGPRPSSDNLKKLQSAMAALDHFTSVLEGGQAARNVRNTFIIPFEQIADKYINLTPRVYKWFPKISTSHKNNLIHIWETIGAVVKDRMDAMEELTKEESRPLIERCMKQMSTWMGVWIQKWIEEIRPSMKECTEEELQYVLRWTLYHMIAALVIEQSPLFSDAIAVVKREVMDFFRVTLINLMNFTGIQASTYQLTPQQIQEAILARTEKEKAFFIKRFDDLDRDMRKVELMKKKLKIGDWAVGTVKNLFNYNADFYEFEREQRAQMGLPEFSMDITGVVGGSTEDRYGFYGFGQQPISDGAYDHRAVHDED